MSEYKGPVAFTEYKEIRYWILRLLYNQLPAGCSAHTLSGMLLSLGYTVSELHVTGHLRYLADADKEYIDLEEKESRPLGISRQIATLNSKGVDFVEGNLPEDPGIIRK
jgi:hypothetical protein